jgi:hypothetical protein
MSTLVAQTISNGIVSTSSVNVIQGSAKAWVNFNGSGTVAIRGSFNVSSITDHSAGQYSVNFTNALTDANYSVVVSADPSDTSGGIPYCGLSYSGFSPTGSFARVRTTASASFQDSPTVCVVVFR